MSESSLNYCSVSEYSFSKCKMSFSYEDVDDTRAFGNLQKLEPHYLYMLCDETPPSAREAQLLDRRVSLMSVWEQ